MTVKAVSGRKPLYETELGKRLVEAAQAKQQTLTRAARLMGMHRNAFHWARLYGVADEPHREQFWQAVAEYIGITTEEARALARQQLLAPDTETRLQRVEDYRLAQPVTTFVGTQFYRPVRHGMMQCETCAAATVCHEVVMERDGFALCEDVISEDLCLPEPERVAGGYGKAVYLEQDEENDRIGNGGLVLSWARDREEQ